MSRSMRIVKRSHRDSGNDIDSTKKFKVELTSSSFPSSGLSTPASVVVHNLSTVGHSFGYNQPIYLPSPPLQLPILTQPWMCMTPLTTSSTVEELRNECNQLLLLIDPVKLNPHQILARDKLLLEQAKQKFNEEKQKFEEEQRKLLMNKSSESNKSDDVYLISHTTTSKYDRASKRLDDKSIPRVKSEVDKVIAKNAKNEVKYESPISTLTPDVFDSEMSRNSYQSILVGSYLSTILNSSKSTMAEIMKTCEV